MLEHSLLTDLLRKIHTIALDNPGMVAAKVRIRLGARCRVDKTILKTLFRSMSRGTVAEHGVLSINPSVNSNDLWAEHMLLEGVQFKTIRKHARATDSK